MRLVTKIMSNRYIDSVSLMALSTKANQIEEIDQIIIAMATDMNKEVMANVGLLDETIAKAASSDLVITMKIQDSAHESEIFE